MKNLSKLGKRGLALVLALVLLVGMVPLSASANTYDQITVNYVVNGVTLRTDTLSSGRYIQIANRVPYVSDLIAGTAYADYDYGTVTKIECRPHQYFPNANFLREGQSIEHSGNYKTHTITYTTSKWEKHQTVVPPTDGGNGGGNDGDDGTISTGGSGNYSWTQKLVYHANYPGGEDPQITVTYNARGSFGNMTVATITPKTFDGCGFSLPEGYSLAANGWYSADVGGSYLCSMGGSFSLNYKDRNTTTHLFAHYKNDNPIPDPTYGYILNWEYNGGTLNGKDHDSETALNLTGEKNATHTFYEQVDKRPSRNGYKFGGWVYSGNGTFTESNGQIVMTGRDGSTVTGTMTAQWYANPSVQVTLTYDANGGENPPAKQMVNVGSEVIVKGKEQMTKSGYTFKGWSNRSDATEPDVMPENTLRLNDNTTLFAVWEKNKTITVTWKDGYTDTPIKKVTIDQGGDYSTLYPSAPTREGHTFTKWGEPVEDPEGNITITAQWKQNAETPNISISKIPDATAYTAGADVSWNITVTNNGTSAVSGLSIADELTKDSEPFTGVAITSPDGFSGTPDNFTLEAGQSVTFKATVEAATAGTYVNKATVKKDEKPLDEATSVEVVVTEETEPAAPAITVHKEADKTAAKAGETVTYTITVANTGDAQATNVTVTDLLDRNLTFVSYQLGEETVNTQPEGGVYTIGTLEANDVATLVIQATVNADVEAGTIIVNTATADYDGKPDEENPTDHAEVNVIQPDPVDPDPDPTDPGPGPVDPPTPPTPIVTPEPVATPTPSAEPTVEPSAEPTDDPDIDIDDPDTPLGPGPSDDPGTDIPDEDPPMGDNPILNLVDHYHYLVGYPDGSIRPGANITRAEVAEVFYRLMTADARVANWATGNSYSDVIDTAWYTDAINVMSKAGIVNGYEDGTARPNRAITRAEFAMIASQFLADYVEDPGTTTFTDIQGHWAESAIRKVQSIGWVNGDAGTTNFRPNDKITRAEAAVIFNNMLERTPDAEHLDGAMKVWPDNDPGAWYYAAMQEATNSHYYTGNEETESEEWAEVFEHDWVALKAYWKANAGQSPEE